MAAKASLQRTYDHQIMTPMQLFNFAEREITGITFAYCTVKEWEDARNFCHERFKISRGIEGTQKLHAFIPKSNSKLLVKPYSRSENCKEVEVATAFQGINFGEIRGFVTVKYDNNWYVAGVLDTFIDTFEVKVSFLLPAGPANPSSIPSYLSKHFCQVVMY